MSRTYIPLPRAGRLGLPAAIVHPDDELPKTWRVVSTWTYRGQRGAYLSRVAPTHFAALHDVSWAQIVYRTTAPRRRGSHVGNAIGHATGWQTCSVQSWDLERNAERTAYYAEQGIDVKARDAAGKAAAEVNEELEERRRSARASVVDAVAHTFPNASPEEFERRVQAVWAKMTRTLSYLR